MDDGKKKQIMIVLFAICLVAAVVITIMTRSDNAEGIDALKDETIYMKCRKCKATYEINRKEYEEYQRENKTYDVYVVPLPCEKCDAEDAWRAVKCEKCSEIFEYGAVKGKQPDTCTKCGFSKVLENRRNK